MAFDFKVKFWLPLKKRTVKIGYVNAKASGIASKMSYMVTKGKQDFASGNSVFASLCR